MAIPLLTKSTVVVACLVAVITLSGCGNSVSGTYASKGGAYDSLTFNSGDKVEIKMVGMTLEGAYSVDGKKVKVTIAGQTLVFTIDDQKCLDGGGPIGKYCKGKS